MVARNNVNQLNKLESVVMFMNLKQNVRICSHGLSLELIDIPSEDLHQENISTAKTAHL